MQHVTHLGVVCGNHGYMHLFGLGTSLARGVKGSVIAEFVTPFPLGVSHWTEFACGFCPGGHYLLACICSIVEYVPSAHNLCVYKHVSML